MDMQQEKLEGYQVIERDEKGNITSVAVYTIGRNDEGHCIEILVSKEEWAVVDGLNQRIN
jgi:hypothetical protein